jgi:tetratricopeptide (TPR) repeat protein
MSLGNVANDGGMYEEAAGWFQKGINQRGESTGGLCYLGYNLAMSGRKADAESILTKLNKTKGYVSPQELAGFYVGLGEREQAFAALERAYAEHDLQLQVLKVDWRMESLRSDPRFQNLLRRVGLL